MKRATLMMTATAFAIALGGLAEAKPFDRGDRAGRMGPPMINFAAADTDGNGALSQDEIQAYGKARLAAADADGDGLLSAEELVSLRETERQMRMQRMGERMIERLDANEDGKLSIEELTSRGDTRRDRMFDRIDADGDGEISEAEFEAMGKRMADRRDGGRDHRGHRFGSDR